MHMRRGDKQTLKTNQQGMAAMVIVMVLMFVVSVIVLGFAQVVRREQRNALDNQLATQAYYAAESGLNLAQNEVKKLIDNGGSPTAKTDCTDPQGYPDISSQLEIGENAEITCVLIDPELEYLNYQKIGMHSVPMLVKAKSGTISDIYVSWESPTNTTTSAGCNGAASNNFEPGPSWDCPQPLLRLDVVPAPSGANPVTVASSQFTTFLSPNRSGSSTVTYSPGSVSNVSSINCTTPNPRKCTARITGLGGPAYALRIMSVYGESNVTVHATNSSGTPLTLIEGQVLIDVTARAADVLKRLQASMSVSVGESIPDSALTAGGGVCKRYQISGGDPSIDGTFPECRL